MPFDEAVRGRRSVRRYRAAPVPREDVERMVALATEAASAGNAQMWRFIAVQNPDTLRAMKAAVEETFADLAARPQLQGRQKELRRVLAYSTFFVRAPLCIAVCALPYYSKGDQLLDELGVGLEERHRLRQRPDLQSVGGAVQLLITAAYAMGYGSCWMSGPVLAAERLEVVLGVEPPAQLVALVPVGRPAGRIGRRKRLPLDAVLSFR